MLTWKYADTIRRQSLDRGLTIVEAAAQAGTHADEEAHTQWEWHVPTFPRTRELGLIAFSTPFDENGGFPRNARCALRQDRLIRENDLRLSGHAPPSGHLPCGGDCRFIPLNTDNAHLWSALLDRLPSLPVGYHRQHCYQHVYLAATRSTAN